MGAAPGNGYQLTRLKSAETWDVEALLSWFIETCWQEPIAAYAKDIRQQIRTTLFRKTILSTQIDSFFALA